MARSIDSDYIDFSQMGGFDMGINLDEFEDNVKRFIEAPMKYIDSAHDKAADFIADVQAIFYANFVEEVPNNDQSSHYVTTESSPTSIEKEFVGPHIPPASFITMENSSTGCVDTESHQTESCPTKSTGLSLINHVHPENNSSEGDPIESNDLCILPEDNLTTRIYESSEEVILWNPETSVKPQRRSELTTILQDDHAPPAVETDKVTEQSELNCSGHSDSSVCSGIMPLENSRAKYEEQMVLHSTNDPGGATVNAGACNSHDLSASVSCCADDPSLSTDSMDKFVDIDLKDGQKHMKNDKIEAHPIPRRENASFKKMFLRSLSRKLQWSKKQACTHQTMAPVSQDAENLEYQLVSSSDDLEDGWEVL